jgi:outer membrane protein assembly factor BamA
LGGDFFYAATLAASIPFPGWPLLSNNGVRLFGFTNFGTLTALQPSTMNDILKSTRLAAGGGIVAATPLGRLECTYAVPLRYSPRDARRSVQVGFGFSFE